MKGEIAPSAYRTRKNPRRYRACRVVKFLTGTPGAAINGDTGGSSDHIKNCHISLLTLAFGSPLEPPDISVLRRDGSVSISY